MVLLFQEISTLLLDKEKPLFDKSYDTDPAMILRSDECGDPNCRARKSAGVPVLYDPFSSGCQSQ